MEKMYFLLAHQMFIGSVSEVCDPTQFSKTFAT